MTVSWCTLSGQTRVRSGLSLTTAGFVADPAQFRDVPGFTAHPTGTAYRETIARVLYGTDEAWLNQLNRILRVVRTPQIGHKIDLKFLTQAFRTALPPIAQDEINQLADGWEQLQRLRDERDEAEQALAAVTEFSRRAWRPWADAVIRAAADPVASAASTLTQITREESAAREAVSTLSEQKAKPWTSSTRRKKRRSDSPPPSARPCRNRARTRTPSAPSPTRGSSPSRPARPRQRRIARSSAPARQRLIFSPHSNG